MRKGEERIVRHDRVEAEGGHQFQLHRFILSIMYRTGHTVRSLIRQAFSRKQHQNRHPRARTRHPDLQSELRFRRPIVHPSIVSIFHFHREVIVSFVLEWRRESRASDHFDMREAFQGDRESEVVYSKSTRNARSQLTMSSG